MSRHLSRPAIGSLIVFLVACLLYWPMIPFVMFAWKITGDEPHYLLAAHSLVFDRDLDLKNNYLNGDHRDFYPLGFLDPHVKEQPDGTWLLSHDIGLPIIIAPAYALGGRLGVMRFFAILGGLLAAQMFLLAWEVSGKWWAGLLGALAMALSAPLSLYVFQVYPEAIGGLLVMVAARHILQTPRWIDPGWTLGIWRLVSGVCLPLAILPWLSGRYLPLVIFLTVVAVWKQWADRRLWIAACAVALASIALYLTLNLRFFGGPTPSATAAGNAVAAGFSDVSLQQIGRGLAAWLFDQQRGLLVYGPVLVVALFGIPHLWNQRRWDGVMLLAPLAIMWILASVWGGFYIGWEISARFLMVGVPLMVAPIAAIVARVKNVLFWPLAAGLLTLSLLNTVIIVLDPFYAYHESPIKFYEDATQWSLRPLLPALGTRSLIRPSDAGSEWLARAGDAKYLVQSTMQDLSIGYYKIRAQAELANASPPDAVALTFDVFSSESGIPLAHADVRADPTSPVVNVDVPFYNPYFDKWNFPLYVDVRTTGAADVRLSWLLFEPDPIAIYGRVGIWIVGIALLTVAFAINPIHMKAEEGA